MSFGDILCEEGFMSPHGMLNIWPLSQICSGFTFILIWDIGTTFSFSLEVNNWLYSYLLSIWVVGWDISPLFNASCRGWNKRFGFLSANSKILTNSSSISLLLLFGSAFGGSRILSLGLTPSCDTAFDNFLATCLVFKISSFFSYGRSLEYPRTFS